jgi:hypothetical protein
MGKYPFSGWVEVIIIITNMAICPMASTYEVERWNSHAGTFNPADFSWRGLVMTPAAAAHIRDLVRKQPDMQGLRLGVKTSGCAGLATFSS